MPPGGILTHDPSKRSAADLRLRPPGHWDRPNLRYYAKMCLDILRKTINLRTVGVPAESRRGHLEKTGQKSYCLSHRARFGVLVV
jgi:hypothetical protein